MELTKIVAFLCIVLTGCVNVQQSLPIGADVVAKGLTLKRALPDHLPDGAVAIPATQYIIINADSAALEFADMLNPIPFVLDMAKKQVYQHNADEYKERFSRVDPFVIASARMANSPLLSLTRHGLPLKPFVYMVEGSDDRWRLSLTFRVESQVWQGRYMYHLPTTYSGKEIRSADPAILETLRQELVFGSDLLRQLMERDARGDLKGDGQRVEFGSYYVVGSNVLGMLPANLVRFRDAELLEEGSDYVILRSRGDLHTDAASGALAFGVHYFRKDQLQDFKKEGGKAG